MFQISVEGHFDAAHYLRGYQGKCEALHGHRFRVVVRVKAATLDDTGLAYDFTHLKRHMNEVIAKLDHTCLNDIPPFDRLNPSSENIAATIYRDIKPKLGDAPVTIACIEVWESPESSAVYIPD
ncbi:MAG: 6-carboxytetrahydropterin synthase QueD [Chloroflexota bacterium]